MNIETDKSVPPVNSENCIFLLSNAHRGFRTEHYITLGAPLSSYPLDCQDPFEKAQSIIEKYRDDSPVLCQLYVYLSNYCDKPLDGTAFEQLKKIFELYRDNNVRLLLRFAYSTEAVPDAPYKTVKLHLSQIDAWFRENSELAADALYCMQTGIIGLWGEGHSYKRLRKRHIKRVIHDVCEITPDGVFVQVRTYDMLKKVSPEHIEKVGIHDDYIIGDMNHQWSFIPQSKKQKFTETVKHAKFTVNDGEMPWGRATLNDKEGAMPLGSLDGKAVLKQLSAYSLTSLSLEHNYKENGNEYSLAKWKNEYLSYGEAAKLGISVNPNLFKNQKNEDVKLSVYDIIRYHLGYHLALTDYSFQSCILRFSVTNYGFAAPLNFNYFAVAVRNVKNGEISEIPVKAYDKRELLSGKCIKYTLALPEGFEPVGVKADVRKGGGINPRFANSTPFVDGIQYFK